MGCRGSDSGIGCKRGRYPRGVRIGSLSFAGDTAGAPSPGPSPLVPCGEGRTLPRDLAVFERHRTASAGAPSPAARRCAGEGENSMPLRRTSGCVRRGAPSPGPSPFVPHGEGRIRSHSGRSGSGPTSPGSFGGGGPVVPARRGPPRTWPERPQPALVPQTKRYHPPREAGSRYSRTHALTYSKFYPCPASTRNTSYSACVHAATPKPRTMYSALNASPAIKRKVKLFSSSGYAYGPM
jgi:hypothetical protein